MDYSMIKGIESIPEPFGSSSVKHASSAGLLKVFPNHLEVLQSNRRLQLAKNLAIF
jgi:hypothetical protein